MRLDKWLHVAQVFKTRSRATEACERGRVQVNGGVAKPHRVVRAGDRLTVELGDWSRVLVVRELAEHSLPKAEARNLYEDLSPPRPAPDPLARLLRRPPVQRDAGAGRPTKRERRRLERERGND